jgi:hypothetical protein
MWRARPRPRKLLRYSPVSRCPATCSAAPLRWHRTTVPNLSQARPTPSRRLLCLGARHSLIRPRHPSPARPRPSGRSWIAPVISVALLPMRCSANRHCPLRSRPQQWALQRRLPQHHLPTCHPFLARRLQARRRSSEAPPLPWLRHSLVRQRRPFRRPRSVRHHTRTRRRRRQHSHPPPRTALRPGRRTQPIHSRRPRQCRATPRQPASPRCLRRRFRTLLPTSVPPPRKHHHSRPPPEVAPLDRRLRMQLLRMRPRPRRHRRRRSAAPRLPSTLQPRRLWRPHFAEVLVILSQHRPTFSAVAAARLCSTHQRQNGPPPPPRTCFQPPRLRRRSSPQLLMHSVVQPGQVLQQNHQTAAWRSPTPRRARLRSRFQRGQRPLPARPRFLPSHNSGTGNRLPRPPHTSSERNRLRARSAGRQARTLHHRAPAWAQLGHHHRAHLPRESRAGDLLVRSLPLEPAAESCSCFRVRDCA